MTRRINSEGMALIKQWEGCKLTAYQDVAGVWTIGYGSTGPHVRPGLRITQEQAEALLVQDLDRFERAVDTGVTVDLTDNQFAALVSFAFNVGTGAFARSTLLRKLNAGDYAAVPSELAKWVNAGGRRVQGLVNRRAAEAGLWARGSFVSSRDVPAVPPTVNPWTRPETIATVGPAAGGVLAAASDGPMAYAVAAVLVIGAIVAAVYFIRRSRRESS